MKTTIVVIEDYTGDLKIYFAEYVTLSYFPFPKHTEEISYLCL